MSGAATVRVPGWVVIPAGLLTVAAVIAVVVALRPDPEPTHPDATATAEPKSMKVFRFLDPEDVQHRSRFLFTFDPPSVLQDHRKAEKLDEVIAGATTDLERFRRVTAWARNQFEPGVPDPYPPMDARIILRDIRSGFTGGFCAQYNYVVVQSLASLGYVARYVTVAEHEVLEAWLPDERRWVCLDPLYSATYVDERGRALSVLDLARRHREKLPVIPGPGSLPETAGEVASAFSRFAVWLRNDHISRPINFTDIDRYKVAFVWGPVDRPSGILSTDLPEDLYFVPARDLAP